MGADGGLTREALAAAGVPEPARVLEVAERQGAWLAALPLPAIVGGLARAADPAAALHAVGRLAEHAAIAAGEVTALLAVCGGSPAIAAGLLAEGPAWPALFATVADVPSRLADEHATLLADQTPEPVSRPALQNRLRVHRRRELVRIGGRDLLGLGVVDDTVRELSALADGVIAAAVASTRRRLAAEWGGDPDVPFVVLGMGKLGGGELNYSSDVDLVYVYERDEELPSGRTAREFFVRLAEEVTRVVAEVTEDGFCFRVDLRLRPGGAEGPLAVSLPAAISYYETWGQTWERAVWLKGRPVGGTAALGHDLLRQLDPFVFRRFLDFATLDDLKAMKRKVDASLRGPDAHARDVKLGRGGIRSVEFWVQAHQLVHGGKDARLRVRGTLPALERLAACGYAEPGLVRTLAAAYRFLRDVEHKLQIVHERQTQRLPTDPEERALLARRLRLFAPDPAAAFQAAYVQHTGAVDEAFSALFHAAEEERRRDERPELAALLDLLEQADAARWQLGQLGFRDPAAAYEDLRLLRDGPPHAPSSPRRRAALTALAPRLLGEIAASADPDRALHLLASFIASIGARTSYLHLLLENPGVMRLLVRLFATSEFLSRYFLRHPELLDSLVRADLVRLVRTRDELVDELFERLAATGDDFEAELDTLRRFRHEEFLRIGVHDIQGELDAPDVGSQLSLLADVCLSAALAIARRDVGRKLELSARVPTENLVVLAMGKLGGAELAYHSDLDLIFVYDPGDPALWPPGVGAHEVFTRIAQRTISVLQTPTREGIVYKIDTRLRPSGNKGTLVSSIEAFETYHRTEAALWERQALVKARAATGPAPLRVHVEAIIARVVYGRGLTPDEAREVAHMRERIAAERGAAAGRVNIKTDWGGLVDVEFLVQMLQLAHGHAEPRLRVRSTRAALDVLAETGLLPAADAQALRDGWAFLQQLGARLRIERDQAVEALDEQPEALRALARRLGYDGDDAPARLRADVARHRAAIRETWARAVARLTAV
ncbi:MAG: bifunctional [glutamate--ammonia ligase]-adenylyl-L-tyrosine phosphorylase/[glutamate--ammonia-ligase] adenylyltransferase [bacterium]|nr:bifunctional [glutamate--ammonia ligase]-adenylyl-L-tyrosine phosphorylase/[glutamate--ammonia-ligase] adenylyltransferase [bacterium]